MRGAAASFARLTSLCRRGAVVTRGVGALPASTTAPILHRACFASATEWGALAPAPVAYDEGDAAAYTEPVAAQTRWRGIKRFYTRVEVGEHGGPVPAEYSKMGSAGGSTGRWYTVLVDGRTMRTSGMNPLLLPSPAMAHAIATEFRVQQDVVLPASTPLYNLASAAIDTYVYEDVEGNEDVEASQRAGRLASLDAIMAGRGLRAGDGSVATPAHAQSHVTGRHDSGAMTSSGVGGTGKLRDLLLDFLETDTACFRVDVDSADPSEKVLRKRQDKYYGPLLQWWKDAFGVELGVVEGFKDVPHPEDAYLVAEDAVDRADPFLKATIHHVLTNTKSTVLTLALVHGGVDVETAFDASRVEEEFQIRSNGFVEDGHDVGRAQLRVALTTAATFLALAPESAPPPVPTPATKNYAAVLAAAATARRDRVMARRHKEVAAVEAKRRQMAAQAAADRAATHGGATA